MAIPVQLGIATTTTPFSTTSASAVDVTGMAAAGCVVGALPVRATMNIPQGVTSSVAADIWVMNVVRGSTAFGGSVVAQPSAGGSGGAFSNVFEDAPAGGTYTYKLQLYRFSGSGTVTMNAIGTPFFCIASLIVAEVQ